MTPSAIITKDLAGRITSWNDGAEILFGYSAMEAVGKHISIIIPFDWQDEEYDLLDRLKAEEVLEVRETVRRTKDGRFLSISLRVEPLRNSAGKIIGARKESTFIGELEALPAAPSSPYL